MPGPYLSDATILGKVQATLNVGSFDAASNWPSIVADAHIRGYQGLVAILAKRGFTQSQVDNWDRRAEFEADLSLFWAFVLGGIGANYDPTFLKMLDRREELEGLTITTNGMQAIPAALPPTGSLQTTPGPVGSGTMNTTNDVFVLRNPTGHRSDSLDSRRGYGYSNPFPNG